MKKNKNFETLNIRKKISASKTNPILKDKMFWSGILTKTIIEYRFSEIFVNAYSRYVRLSLL